MAPHLDRFLKSFTLSALLFAVWGWLGFRHALSLGEHFDPVELLWVIYNVTLALLFLLRSRPSIVSLNGWHWLVALLTSFSGFFFDRRPIAQLAAQRAAADVIMAMGLLVGVVAAVSLRRSYDFIPALRRTQTGGAYRVVRHPMYMSSMAIRLGYLVRHPSALNLGVFAIMIYLYILRAAFEETIMNRDPVYQTYRERVRWKFIPGLH